MLQFKRCIKMGEYVIQMNIAKTHLVYKVLHSSCSLFSAHLLDFITGYF